MEPVRILQVLASLDRGGAETMIMNLYRNIDKNKIQFDFVVNDRVEEYAYESEIKKLGGRIFRMPKYKISNYFPYKNAWIQLISQHPEWKIVHGHHTSPASIYLKVAKAFNCKTIAHSHIAGEEKTVKSRMKIIMRYPLRYIAHYLFACSRAAGEWLFGEKECNRDNFYVLNNAIDAKKFSFNVSVRNEKRKELQLEDKYVIGHVGRFQTQKNHTFLIDIFKGVADKYENAVLLLVGDGELRPSLEKKVNHLGLSDKVIFTGVRADISDLMQAMDVFVFPSLYEGLPVTLIEAQASGLPCVVSDTITKEIYLTNLIKSVELSSTVKEWSEEILNFKIESNKRDTSKEIIGAGYDVEKNSKWIEEFYFNILGSTPK